MIETGTASDRQTDRVAGNAGALAFLHQSYRFVDETAVSAFLVRTPNLIDVLVEGRPAIIRSFGPSTNVELDVVPDYDFGGGAPSVRPNPDERCP